MVAFCFFPNFPTFVKSSTQTPLSFKIYSVAHYTFDGLKSNNGHLYGSTGNNTHGLLAETEDIGDFTFWIRTTS